MVALLALAHERACEAELAAALDATLDAGPCRTCRPWRAGSRQSTAAVPEVIVTLPSLDRLRHPDAA